MRSAPHITRRAWTLGNGTPPSCRGYYSLPAGGYKSDVGAPTKVAALTVVSALWAETTSNARTAADANGAMGILVACILVAESVNVRRFPGMLPRADVARGSSGTAKQRFITAGALGAPSEGAVQAAILPLRRAGEPAELPEDWRTTLTRPSSPRSPVHQPIKPADCAMCVRGLVHRRKLCPHDSGSVGIRASPAHDNEARTARALQHEVEAGHCASYEVGFCLISLHDRASPRGLPIGGGIEAESPSLIGPR